MLRQPLRRLIAIAEDADAHQSYHACHVIAVRVQLFECLVHHQRARARRVVAHIHLRARHQLVQQLHGNQVSLLRVAQRHEHGIVRAAHLHRPVIAFDVGLQLFVPLPRSHSRIVGQIIGVAHEGVHRAQRVALAPGKQHESVVKIFRALARNLPTHAVGGAHLQCRMLIHGAHPARPNAIRPASARSASPVLLSLLRLGRLTSTL